jgi:ribonuclease P protein component
MALRLPKPARLGAPGEFARVKNEGASYPGRYFVLAVLRGDPPDALPRIGLITSRRVGNSVIRHRVRRRLRELFRRARPSLRLGLWLVLIGRAAAADASAEALENEFQKLGRRADIFAQRDFLDIARQRAMETKSHGRATDQPAGNFGAVSREACQAAREYTRGGGAGAQAEPRHLGTSPQTRAFFRWAGENGAIVRSLPKPFGGGAEHHVARDGSRVVKTTKGRTFGAVIDLDSDGNLMARLGTAAEYLDRIHLAREILGDDIGLVGAYFGPEGVSIVTNQRYIEGLPAHIIDADRWMTDRGFRRIRPFEYYNPTINVWAYDVRGANFIKDAAGDCHPIDIMLSEPRPETAAKLTAEPEYIGPLVDYPSLADAPDTPFKPAG